MLKKTIVYEDYNGIERKEDFYFNLSKADIMKMELSIDGGMSEMLKKIVNKKDGPTIMKTFEDIILSAYGEKSADGRQFIKDEALSKAFSQTEAYSILFMELLTDDKAASDFVNGIMPSDAKDAIAQAKKQLQEA